MHPLRWTELVEHRSAFAAFDYMIPGVFRYVALHKRSRA
jgi:hypothetical protein